MLTLLGLFLFFVFLVLTLWWYVVYFKYEVHLSKFSGPPCLPIIGSLHHTGIQLSLLPKISQLEQQYGKCIKLMLGFAPRLVLTDLKSVEFVLTSNRILKKSYEYSYFHSWLGMGLLTSFGLKWKQHRKLLTPAFHFKILERFIDVFDYQSNILIKTLDKNIVKTLDVVPYVTLYALDVICESTMNTTVNAQLNPTSSYVKGVKEICRIILDRTFSIKMWDAIYLFSKDYHKEKRLIKCLHDLTNSVIKRRREGLLIEPTNNFNNISDWGSKKRVAFLDILLTSTINGNPLELEAIREEVDTFMFEGHETVSSGISFTLYCLSQYQDIQNKVFDEITEVLGNRDVLQLSYKNLQKMKYCEQVIKEVMRLYPPVPLFSRITTEDTIYEDKIIPKGVSLLVSVYHLHRNEELFANPEQFDPERFNAENSKSMLPFSYIPFSAGPRNCIGQRFAMLEMKVAVCKILQKFKLLPVLGHEPLLLANAILSSQNGLPICFKKRIM